MDGECNKILNSLNYVYLCILSQTKYHLQYKQFISCKGLCHRSTKLDLIECLRVSWHYEDINDIIITVIV